MFPEGYGYPATSFEQSYRCYSASFIDKPQLESGDKVILPPSALDRLASLHIEYPMLFELHNHATESRSHCGVLEFTAEEGMLYMSYWMMQNLLLQEGDTVKVKNATLPKGTYAKLQPHTKDFLDISNPKAVLETTLRNFSCLTTGDTIMVSYNNKKYYIDVIETKPCSAISIIETDCEVDFAPPLDYKVPERRLTAPSAALNKRTSQETREATEPKFVPFTGVGRRTDGKLVEAPVTSSRTDNSASRPTNSESSGSGSSSGTERRPSGKLVFSRGIGKDAVKAVPREAIKRGGTKETINVPGFYRQKIFIEGLINRHVINRTLLAFIIF